VSLAGGTVLPAGTPARVTTNKPSGKPKQAQTLLAEVTVNGRVYAVLSQPARVEGSAAASSQAKAAGAVGVTVKGFDHGADLRRGESDSEAARGGVQARFRPLEIAGAAV
jgi:hypothetical protein